MLRSNGNGAEVRSGSLEEEREGCIRYIRSERVRELWLVIN